MAGGFTLIELLVVAALIGLMAAMLVPALARSGPDAKAMQCRNNLKALTMAWRMYAEDSKDYLVAAETGMTGRPTWVSGVMDYDSSNQSNWNINQDLARSPLWTYLGRDWTRFKCPADPSSVVVPGGRKRRVRSVSMSDVFGNGEWLPKTSWRTYGKGGEIMIPAETFVFTDEHPASINDGCFVNVCTGADHPGGVRIVDFPGSCHDRGACGISFADGRAETHKWLGTRIKPPVNVALLLSVPDGDSWVDMSWLAQNTTVRR